MAELVAQSALPTYRKTNVTGETKDLSDIVMHRPSEGRGMAFGSVFHRCVEALGNGMELTRLESFVRMIALEEGMLEIWIPEVIAAIEELLESDLWRRASRALQRYHEFSFMISGSSESAVRDSDNTEINTIMKGVIDLLFEETDGWVIVDFKTDMYEAEYEQEFIDYYKPQVMAYVQTWEQTFGYKVKEAGLYFVNGNKYVVL